MADKREFLVVIDGKESVSPAAGKASDSLGKLGDKAKATEKDFDGLDKTMREHADTIANLRQEIAKTGDVTLFKELGKNERAFGKLEGLKKSLSNAAGDAAPDMALSLGGRLGPLLAKLPVSGPVALALGAATVAAAPAIGATIAGAIIGGASIGGVVGGALIASKDPRVKAAFGDLSKSIGADLRQAAAPFVPALLGAVKQVRAGFGPIGDDLQAIFAKSAQFVAPLTTALLRAGKSITGGLSSLITGAGGPAIQAIADGLIDVGDALGDVFKSLSDNGPEAALALSDLFDVIEGTIRGVGMLVNGLTELYGILRLGVAGITGNTDAIVRWVEGHRQGSATAAAFTDALKAEGSAAYTTAQMVDLLTSALDEQVNTALSAWEANIRYKQSLEAAGEAADKKRGISVAEEAALAALATQTNVVTRATDDNSESAAVAKKRYDDATAAFINTAIKMGYTREQAARLSDEMLKIPKKIATQVIVDQRPAITAVRNIQKAINGLRGRTIRNVIVTGELGGDDIGAMHGMSEGGSVGGNTPPGKDAQVRVLASDEFVLTGKEVRQAGGPGAIKSAMSGGGVPAPAQASGGSRSLVLQIAPGRMSGLERMFLSWLKESIANAGGNPAALGY